MINTPCKQTQRLLLWVGYVFVFKHFAWIKCIPYQNILFFHKTSLCFFFFIVNAWEQIWIKNRLKTYAYLKLLDAFGELFMHGFIYLHGSMPHKPWASLIIRLTSFDIFWSMILTRMYLKSFTLWNCFHTVLNTPWEESSWRLTFKFSCI